MNMLKVTGTKFCISIILEMQTKTKYHIAEKA